MITNKTINEILSIDESYKAPQKMLDILLDDSKRVKLFEEFLSHENDLSYEWFQNYFESEHADRKVKKQDFTPDSISKLGAMILGKSDSYFEATAGTGGMLIQFWNNNPDAFFEVEELSDRAIPFLIFNMAIRNIKGKVSHGDSLKQEFKGVYELVPSDKFSKINVR